VTNTEARWAIPTEAGHDQWMADLEVGERKLVLPKRLQSLATNEFIYSTETEARDGDIIEQSSWRLAEYRRNPVVLDNHAYGTLVGRTEILKTVDNELRGVVLWDDAEQNPRGQQVARWHREGWRKAVSVRWMTGKRTPRNELPEDHPLYDKGREVDGFFGPFTMVGDYLQRCTLLEVSSVDVPGDAKALQVRFAGARQVPDQGARVELMTMLEEAHANGRLAESDALRAAVVDILLGAARTNNEFRTALAAIGTDLFPQADPATPPSALRAWLSKD
jgi:hypothetical protein